MRGTGTQSDPYIIENFADLLQINGGIGTYYKLGTDIDANDSPYAETGWQSVGINCTELDGDNHTIRNITIINTSVSELKTAFSITAQSAFRLCNLNLENVYLNGGKSCIFQKNNNSSATFYRVNVAAKALQSVASNYTSNLSLLIYSQVGITIENSCINCNLHSLCTVPLVRGSLVNCHIKYDIEFTTLGSDSKLFATDKLMNTAAFSNLTGKGASVDVYAASEIYNSYFVMPTMTNIRSFKTDNAVKTVSFYDADEAPESVVFSANLNALTTQQCKSADYLRSIGFLAEGLV